MKGIVGIFVRRAHLVHLGSLFKVRGACLSGVVLCGSCAAQPAVAAETLIERLNVGGLGLESFR